MSNKTYYGYSIEQSELASVQSICVLCWGLLGDVFMRVPVIEALKRRFPAANLVVVTDPGSTKVFNNHPDIAEVVSFDRKKKPLFRYLSSLRRQVSYLRRKRFDLCVDLYASDSSARISRWIGARIRLGYDHRPALRKCNNLLVRSPKFCGYWVHALAEMLLPLEVKKDQVPAGPNYYVSDAARAAAKDYAGDISSLSVIYNLGAGAPEKMWPVDRYVSLACGLNKRYGAVPVVLSSPGHEAITEVFIEGYKKHSEACVRVPRVDFDVEAAVVEGVDLIITPDSGLKHLAAGVRTPIAGLYLATRPEYTAPQNVPFVACMVERRETADRCGYPLLERDLPVGLVFNKVCGFVEIVLGWSPLENTVAHKEII
ncbi:hypothetical protein Tel_02890 [Candidatus Tenderia electrophaga]|jgi:ADP-heptose:LPS heptosyltransferase|uniref:Uncharacterized protein n=1 Tax=Candidatus Tenderia electrophaga TaxID=1748243 RepID=A0A0S2TAQ6_9GAMM|nr:hypothetical protein Tel_02890 [Candidatus Tenderia electrophaga]